MTSEAVRIRLGACLNELRESFRADGADLEVVDVVGRIVTIQLKLLPGACEECILPKSVLETIVAAAIQRSAPEVGKVQLIDPREAAGIQPIGEGS